MPTEFERRKVRRHDVDIGMVFTAEENHKSKTVCRAKIRAQERPLLGGRALGVPDKSRDRRFEHMTCLPTVFPRRKRHEAVGDI